MYDNTAFQKLKEPKTSQPKLLQPFHLFDSFYKNEFSVVRAHSPLLSSILIVRRAQHLMSVQHSLIEKKLFKLLQNMELKLSQVVNVAEM